MKRFIALGLLALAANNASAQYEPTPPPSLNEYRHVELRPVKSLTQVHPAVYGKFSSALAKYLESHTARWAAEDRANRTGKRLIIEVSIIDAKFISGQKRFWLGPIGGSSHSAATVEFTDADTKEVLGRSSFQQRAGAMKGTFTVGASDNRMITALAQQVANYIIASQSYSASNPSYTPPSVNPADVTAEAGAIQDEESQTSYYQELIKLNDLRERGIITDEEFNAQKKKVLERAN
jgi:hypothetical protein